MRNSEHICESCGVTESKYWYSYIQDIPDEYGMACSESGVPTSIEIETWICLECETKNRGLEDHWPA